jgi:hypothetical protein
MDPIVMFGAWAAALVSIFAAGRLVYRGFIRATRAAVSEEFAKVWSELQKSDASNKDRLSRLEGQLLLLQEQISRLEMMVLNLMRRPE